MINSIVMTLPMVKDSNVEERKSPNFQPTEDELNPQGALKKALELALGKKTQASEFSYPIFKTKLRTITRRAVLWLGQTCNLRCYFCYFLDRIESKQHPEHEFMTIEKAKEICDKLVSHYRNNAIDIQGGEPTIWKPILELVAHCHKIGLEATLITNALVLDDIEVCKRFKQAGVRDFLMSVHGIGEVHDQVVVRKGAHVRQMNAIRNLREIGIPFRFNCVLSKPVVNQLPEIAGLAVSTGARAVNFLAFNPFEDQAQSGKRSSLNVARYSEIKPKLDEALDILEKNNVEANVRYFPFCMISDRHWKSNYNFQQLSYDHHEWDYASWAWTGMQPQRMKEGPPTEPVPMFGQKMFWPIRKTLIRIAHWPYVGKRMVKVFTTVGQILQGFRQKDRIYREMAKIHAHLHSGYAHTPECERCSLKEICDGFHGDYSSIFGTSEANAIRFAQPIINPIHFIANQEKIIEKEDES